MRTGPCSYREKGLTARKGKVKFRREESRLTDGHVVLPFGILWKLVLREDKKMCWTLQSTILVPGTGYKWAYWEREPSRATVTN